MTGSLLQRGDKVVLLSVLIATLSRRGVREHKISVRKRRCC